MTELEFIHRRRNVNGTRTTLATFQAAIQGRDINPGSASTSWPTPLGWTLWAIQARISHQQSLVCATAEARRLKISPPMASRNANADTPYFGTAEYSVASSRHDLLSEPRKAKNWGAFSNPKTRYT